MECGVGLARLFLRDSRAKTLVVGRKFRKAPDAQNPSRGFSVGAGDPPAAAASAISEI